MIKGICLTAIVFGLLLVVILGIDLAIGMPFGRPSLSLNISLIVAGLILAYLGWSVQREAT